MPLPPLQTRLSALARLGPRPQSVALLAAIDAASTAEADVFLADLLDLAARRRCRPRRRRHLLAQLARRLPLLSPQAQRTLALAAGRDLLALADADPAAGAALAAALKHDHPVRSVADDLDLTDQLACRAAAALVVALATDPNAPAADAARAALLPLADTLSPAHPAQPDLDAAVTRAAREYPDHRDDRPLLAALTLAHRPAHNLRRWLDAETQPGHLALRRLVKSTEHDRFDRAAAHWLLRKSLAGVVLDRLANEQGLPAHPNIAADWPLLLHPARVRHLRRAGRADAILGAANQPTHAHDGTPTRTEPHRLGIVQWAARLPHADKARSPVLAESLTDPAPTVRHAAARALAAQSPGPARDAALADFAFDQHPLPAAVAARSLVAASGLNRRAALAPTLERLAESPHHAVRALAAAARPDADPLAPPPPERAAWLCPVAARRRLAASPDTFLAELDAAIAARDRRRALAALRLVARLDLADRSARHLEPLLAADDPYLAAAAVLTLGRAGLLRPQHDDASHDAQAAIRRSATAALLDHDDPRVRAAAVEALGAHRSTAAGLDALLDDLTPRVRANAAAACVLLEAKPDGPHGALGIVALDAMLADPRPEHRRSALWAVERTNRLGLLRPVVALAKHDHDERIRRRALRCARRLRAGELARRAAAETAHQRPAA